MSSPNNIVHQFVKNEHHNHLINNSLYLLQLDGITQKLYHQGIRICSSTYRWWRHRFRTPWSIHNQSTQMAIVLEAVIQQRPGGITTHAVSLRMRNLEHHFSSSSARSTWARHRGILVCEPSASATLNTAAIISDAMLPAARTRCPTTVRAPLILQASRFKPSPTSFFSGKVRCGMLHNMHNEHLQFSL